MRKKIRFKSLLLDFFVVSVCLFTAAYFTYTFWIDLNTTLIRSDKEEIAQIKEKTRIVQRKSDDRVVWERLDLKTPLYHGDLIRTSNLADTTIFFHNKSSAYLNQNSMINVYKSEDDIYIALSSGSIRLESAEKGKVYLTLDDGSTVVLEKDSSLSASSGANGARSIEMQSGSASVTSKSGETTSLVSGDSVNVHDNGSLRKNSVTVTSIPSNLRVLNFEGGTIPVKLEWSNSDDNAAEPVIVQTSYKKDFSVIAEERTVRGAKDSVLNLPDGTVYWRVFPQSKKEEASEGKISVLPVSPVNLISPSSAATFYYRDRNPDLNFSWSESTYASYYLLKISSYPDMRSPVVEKTLSKASSRVDSLGSGKWYWQVIPYYTMNSIGYAGESAINSFSIEKGDALTPPALTVPLEDSTVFYNDTMDVNFVWKSQTKNATYNLIVSDTEDFSNIIYQKTTTSKNAKVKLPPPESEDKEYYWKVVRNSDQLDDIEPESEVRTFNATKYVSVGIKLLYPPEEFQAEKDKVENTNFVWKLPDKNREKESVIEVSSTPDFEKIDIERKVEDQTFENMRLPEGEWWWRVAAVDSDGKKSEPSEARHIVVLKELSAPEVVDLKDSEEILVAAGSPVNVEWKPVSGADFYNVKIYDSNNNLVTESPAEEANKILLNLPQDTYTCRIQAVAAQSGASALRTGPVEVVEFSVRNASPVVALQPAPHSQIDGLAAVKKPVVFTWKEGADKPASTEFVLKRRLPDGTLKVVESINSTKNSVSLPRLPAGSYQWQVLASTDKGIPLNSEVRDFVVDGLPQLKAATLVSPQNNFVMNTAYLRKNRSINFEWKTVPDATEYSFSLYKREADGKLKSVYTEKNIKGTKARIKKLSILDNGIFVWNVTAYSYAKDGFEERRPAVSSGQFKIEFAAPSKIETVEPEKMYGD